MKASFIRMVLRKSSLITSFSFGQIVHNFRALVADFIFKNNVDISRCHSTHSPLFRLSRSRFWSFRFSRTGAHTRQRRTSFFEPFFERNPSFLHFEFFVLNNCRTLSLSFENVVDVDGNFTAVGFGRFFRVGVVDHYGLF